MNNFEINKVKEILTKELYWIQIGKDEYDDPILKNQFGCIWNGGVGFSEDGNFCGECSMKVPCYYLIYNSCYSFLFESEGHKKYIEDRDEIPNLACQVED